MALHCSSSRDLRAGPSALASLVSANVLRLQCHCTVLGSSQHQVGRSAGRRKLALGAGPGSSWLKGRLCWRDKALGFRDCTRTWEATRPTWVCSAGDNKYSQESRLREEVIAPFRTLRMFLYLGFIGSASVGTFLTLVRVLGQLAGATGEGLLQPLEENLKDLGIDVAALLLFVFLYRLDARAKDAQLAKLSREEALAQLRVELATGRMMKVGQLRGASRLVIVAGPLSHVQRALALARPLKAQLLERGVTVVPYVTQEDVTYSADIAAAGAFSADFQTFAAVVDAEAAALSGEQSSGAVESRGQGTGGTETKEQDTRWLARPLYTTEWDGWLKEQLKLANIDSKAPVYLSLRLDGRVRGSGVGFPRWQVLAAQLPPMKGMWQGSLDGMDGRVF